MPKQLKARVHSFYTQGSSIQPRNLGSSGIHEDAEVVIVYVCVPPNFMQYLSVPRYNEIIIIAIMHIIPLLLIL